MVILKSKVFWVNIVAIIIVAIQYLINNNILPDYVVWEGLALAIFDAIAAALSSQKLDTLKKSLPPPKR
jgi:hypothetical protein